MNRMLVFALMCLVMMSGSAQAGTLEELLAQAEGAERSGNYQEMDRVYAAIWQQGAASLPDAEAATLSLRYGEHLWRRNQYREAGLQLEDALTRHEALYGRDARELIEPLRLLGNVEAKLVKNVAQKHRQMLRIAEKLQPYDAELHAKLLLETGRAALTYGRSKRGGKYLVQALKLAQKTVGASHPLTARAHFWLGKHRLATDRREQAIEQFHLSLAASDGQDQDAVLRSHAQLVQAYEEYGDSDNATRHCLAIGSMKPFDPNQEQQPLFRRRPEFPRAAIFGGHEGYAVIEYTIDDQGFVRDPRVLESVGSVVFGEAAMQAISSWRFAPRFENGAAVATTGMRTKVNFSYYK